MPTLNEQGLKQYPGSQIYYRRKMAVLERRAKHKERLKERIQEELDTTILALKPGKRAKKVPSRDDYFRSTGYIGQQVATAPFEQIQERSMFGGYCRDVPSGATEESWAEEQESRLKTRMANERLCEFQLLAVGYYATIKQDESGKVWITDLYWAPDEIKEDGMLVKADPVEQTDEGCASIFRRLGFQAKYLADVQAYLVTI